MSSDKTEAQFEGDSWECSQLSFKGVVVKTQQTCLVKLAYKCIIPKSY